MRNYFWILGLAVSLSARSSFALPAPSALSAREHRVLAETPTPTPTPQPQLQPQLLIQPQTQTQTQPQLQRQTQPQIQRQTQTQLQPQTQRQTQTRTTKSTKTAISPEGPHPSTVVVIDAGHGGHDRGGIAGQRVSEAVMNLDVAQRLKAVLQASGYRVVMTRDSDVFIPLGGRVAIGNSYRDAIFVCIHFNATPRRGASGIETYFYSSQSLPLASAIHYYVARGAPSANRGVRRRGFYVLRNTRIPSVLVECGFLTNPTEAQYALNAAYRQKLAVEIAHGIQNRVSVAHIPGVTRIASSSSDMSLEPETVPLQPFIDQTHYRDPDLGRSRHKRSSKSSKSTSSKRKKSSSSDSDSVASAKKSTKKKSRSASAED